MTIKEIAKNVVNSLSPKATMDDIIHALYVHAKFQHGEQEIKQKKGISHEDAKKRLCKTVSRSTNKKGSIFAGRNPLLSSPS